MSTNLEELKQKRLKWVEANRENGFDEGINRLLTDLYPDNAHFIYELLQNAEDPGASAVRFTLTESEMEFEHNGERLFTLADVESITSIGNSTKRDDPTSIGKFGVGFKAVFAYTGTPEIHSGDFHFQIRNLVVPEPLGMGKPVALPKTRFVFPFDNPRKPARQAVEEVEQGLRALGDNTLLFLSHIRKIDYTLLDGSAGSLERLDHPGGSIEIRASHPGGATTVSHWLHFQKEIGVVDDDGKQKNCRVAIAYSLVQEEDKKGKRFWKIAPLDRGEVSIFFPAEKETSNLRFHLHAPFASTVARDSVRDCKANHQLRDHIAGLVVESLAAIRDQGLLTVGFLAVLPNPADNLAGNSPFYEPIRKAIVHAFQNEALTPTRSGAHAPATGLYRGPARIAEVLNDDDLSLLTNNEPPLWAANPPQQNQREDRFLDSLEIVGWGWSELASKISGIESEADSKLIKDWIEEKDDAWLMRFYALLGDACSSPHNKRIVVHHLLMIVRTVQRKDDGGYKMHIFPSHAYFPPNDNSPIPEKVCIVMPAVYLDGGTDAQKRSAKHFLEYIGVRVFDIPELAKERLIWYSKNLREEIKKTDYYKDLLLFIDCWKKNPNNAALFKNHQLLLDSNKEWREGTQLCLDVPYRKTGLAELAQIRGINPLWSGYKDKLPESRMEDFVGFLEAIGVMVNPDEEELIKLRLWRYRCPPQNVNDHHHEDIKEFITFLKNNPSKAGLFLDSTFLLGVDQEDKLLWLKPAQLCLDVPYQETGLAEVRRIHARKPVWNGYRAKNQVQLKDFVGFVEAVGVMTRLEITNAPLYQNADWWRQLRIEGVRISAQYGIEEDFTIEQIDSYLSNRSISSSRLIWECLIRASPNVSKARFRPNSNYTTKEADSQLIFHLKKEAWIPNKQGEFCKPQNITRDELRDDFPYNNRNGLLTAIGFGENARKRSEEYRVKNHAALNLGFTSAEQAEKWAALERLGISPDAVFMAQTKRTEQPEESVPNPERRRKGLLERGENAPTKESVNRERSIQPGIANIVAEAKAYLRAKYINAAKQLVCQCCHEEMPFKVGDSHYFEAIQCVRDSDKHHFANRLALCPTCAAMYQHAKETDDAEIHRLIVGHEADDQAPSVEIPVRLAGRDLVLRFVGTHWFDLKTVLSLQESSS